MNSIYKTNAYGMFENIKNAVSYQIFYNLKLIKAVIWFS